MEHCAQGIHFNISCWTFFFSCFFIVLRMSPSWGWQSLVHADRVKSSFLPCMGTVSDSEASTAGHCTQNHIAHLGLGCSTAEPVPGMPTPQEPVLVLWSKDTFNRTAAIWLIPCSMHGCLLTRQFLRQWKAKTSPVSFPQSYWVNKEKPLSLLCSGIFHRKRCIRFSQDGMHPVCFSLGLRPWGVWLSPHFDWASMLAHPSLWCRLHLPSASSPGFTCVLRLLLPLVAPVMNRAESCAGIFH